MSRDIVLWFGFMYGGREGGERGWCDDGRKKEKASQQTTRHILQAASASSEWLQRVCSRLLDRCDAVVCSLAKKKARHKKARAAHHRLEKPRGGGLPPNTIQNTTLLFYTTFTQMLFVSLLFFAFFANSDSGSGPVSVRLTPSLTFADNVII